MHTGVYLCVLTLCLCETLQQHTVDLAVSLVMQSLLCHRNQNQIHVIQYLPPPSANAFPLFLCH